MLTSAAVKAARPTSRAYKMGDAGGLFLLVAPTGLRSWRMKFRYQGREKLLTFGKYPEISLTDARARRDQARGAIDRGEDPSGARRRAAEAVKVAETAMLDSSFEPVARAWHAKRRSRWGEQHAQDVLDSLVLHVFPPIGATPIGDIDAPAVLELLQLLEERGSHETARRVRQRISAIFAFAIFKNLASKDPAAIVVDELEPRPPAQLQPALEEIEDARALLAAVDQLVAGDLVKLASQLLALTGVRLAGVRGAIWSEYEGIDWDVAGDAPAALWRIPPARMKLTKANKSDAAQEHIITLSRAAVEVLRAARAIAGARTGPGDLVFPGRDGGQLGEGAIGDLYRRAGFGGRHVPHGWRATFSTIMNDLHPELRGIIDQALAHKPRKSDEVGNVKVESAYNRAKHLERRREVFERWAALLCDDAADAGAEANRHGLCSSPSIARGA